jgi:hypothetical protein
LKSETKVERKKKRGLDGRRQNPSIVEGGSALTLETNEAGMRGRKEKGEKAAKTCGGGWWTASAREAGGRAGRRRGAGRVAGH